MLISKFQWNNDVNSVKQIFIKCRFHYVLLEVFVWSSHESKTYDFKWLYRRLYFLNIQIKWKYLALASSSAFQIFPRGKNMFKVTRKIIAIISAMCSKVTITTPKRGQWHHCSVFTVQYNPLQPGVAFLYPLKIKVFT